MKANRLNKQSGFTLLEIIIVIIIIGVLAGLALPKFFNTVEFSKSTEALNTLGDMRRKVEHCSMMSGSIDYTSCATLTAISYPDPYTTDNFDYTMTDNLTGAQAGTLDLVATSKSDSNDTITFTIDASDGSLTKAGTGIFVSIK